MIASAAIGAAMPVGTLHGEPSRLLATFLGLISASILPSVSLILGGMTAGSRSVLAINHLHKELRSAVDALFMLLALVGVVFLALFTLALPPPAFLRSIPLFTAEGLPRFGQSVVVGASMLVLTRVGLIPGILLRSLAIRHEIAVEEAKRKTAENIASIGDAPKIFATNPEFGKTVPISELRSQ